MLVLDIVMISLVTSALVISTACAYSVPQMYEERNGQQQFSPEIDRSLENVMLSMGATDPIQSFADNLAQEGQVTQKYSKYGTYLELPPLETDQSENKDEAKFLDHSNAKQLYSYLAKYNAFKEESRPSDDILPPFAKELLRNKRGPRAMMCHFKICNLGRRHRTRYPYALRKWPM